MNNRIQDDSTDKKYFVITPQIVWAQCRDPYDFTLWNVVKMVTAEKGECFLSTDDLAALAMMSTGKVSECRQYLISVGLLEGELRKDPDYPQPVWRLRIPDLWPKNIEWRQKFDSLKDRVAFKRQQKSLHHVKPSPREEGIPPREEGIPPRETKKNQKEKPEEEPAPSAKKDFLTDVFNLQGQTSEVTGDNPEDQWLQVRDKALSAFKGDMGRTPAERQAKKEAICEFVAATPNFDPVHWEDIIKDAIAHGVSANNIARFIEAYPYATYQAYLDAKYPRTENKPNGVTQGKVVRYDDGGFSL